MGCTLTTEEVEHIDNIINDLKDEVADLKGRLEDAEHEESVAWDRVRFAERERDRLRELVADMWRFTGAACKKYPRLFDPAAQGGQMVQPNAIDAFEQRMSELGVHV